jgi:HAE1 family hydrophobic/amphiphilic exporter-1
MFMGGNGNPPNTGRMFIALKPRDQRTANADQVIARLRAQSEKIEGARLFLQAAQDVRVGGRASRTQFQYTLQGSDVAQLNEWAPKMLDKLKSLPELRDVATDQQTNGTTLTLEVNRDRASQYGLTAQVIDDTLYDAFGQRQIAQYFTQLSSYYVIMEVLPSLQGDPGTLQRIFLHSPTTGGEVPLAAFAKWTTHPIQPLSISHQGQFPAITISFNLAQGTALGQATEAIRKAALLRFRPIMMTTMAAMLGGVPLMLGQGTGSELRQPLGYAMVGGLLVSQALTLFTTPVVYLYLDRLSHWMSSWGRHPRPEGKGDGKDGMAPQPAE